MARRISGNLQKHTNANPIQRILIQRFHSEVVRLARSVRADEILEIGCGEGFVLEALSAAGVDGRLRGVDMNAQAIASARRRLSDDVSLDVADALEFEVERPPGLVMMLEVLEHLDRPDEMLRSLADMTAGMVLLSVPFEPYFRGLNLMRLRNVSRLGNDPEHVNHWGRRSFHESVERHFVIEETGHAFPWLLVLAAPRGTRSGPVSPSRVPADPAG